MWSNLLKAALLAYRLCYHHRGWFEYSSATKQTSSICNIQPKGEQSTCTVISIDAYKAYRSRSLWASDYKVIKLVPTYRTNYMPTKMKKGKVTKIILDDEAIMHVGVRNNRLVNFKIWIPGWTHTKCDSLHQLCHQKKRHWKTILHQK